MKYDFNEVKQAFMKMETGKDWEALKTKYPGMHFSDMDMEMKMHMNAVLKRMAMPDQLESPQIHYEVKKK